MTELIQSYSSGKCGLACTTLFCIIIFSPLIVTGQHYEVELGITTARSHIRAKASISWDRISRVPAFSLHGELSVDSLFLDGKQVPFTQSAVFSQRDYSLVTRNVQLKDSCTAGPHSLLVYYSGYFHPSAARSPSDYMRIGPDAEVLLRGEGYSPWFPVFAGGPERMQTFRLCVTTQPDLLPVFLGRELSVTVRDSTRTSCWEAGDIFPRQVQLTARKFQVLDTGTIRLYYTKATARDSAGRIGAFATAMLNYYQEHYKKGAGAVPAVIMEMPAFGDISAANVTGISTEGWEKFSTLRWPAITLAHELVHAFVQLPVPETNPLYALVMEGFPSYFHLPALATAWGEEWYRQRVQRVQDEYLFKREKKIHPRGWALPPEKPVLEIPAGELGSYKDLLVLNDRVILFFDYLRRKMTVPVFNRFAGKLFQQDSLDYQRLIRLVEESLPGEESRVREWLETTAFPDYFRL